MLLSVPNLSIGSGRSRIDQLEAAFGSTATLLDSHSDGTHGRTVLTLAAPPPDLYESLLAGAEAAIDLIDLGRHSGAHPCIGALDVCPVVYPGLGARKLATELAARVAAGLAELGLPVFLYGDLASSEPRRERHFFRRGGLEVLRQRMLGGELDPDYGPAQPHPTAGAAF